MGKPSVRPRPAPALHRPGQRVGPAEKRARLLRRRRRAGPRGSRSRTRSARRPAAAGARGLTKPCRPPSSRSSTAVAARAPAEGVVEAHDHLAGPEACAPARPPRTPRLRSARSSSGERDDQGGVEAVLARCGARFSSSVAMGAGARSGCSTAVGMRVERARDRGDAERAGPLHRGVEDLARARGGCRRRRRGRPPTARSSGGKDGRSADDPHGGAARAVTRSPSPCPTPSRPPSAPYTRSEAADARAGAGDRLPVQRRRGVPSASSRTARPARPARSPAAGAARHSALAGARLADLVPRDGVLERVRAHPRAHEPRERPPRSRARRPDRRRACARRCPCRSATRTTKSGSATGLERDRVDDDLARLARHLDALARQLVEAPAVVVEGRVHRRHLPDRARRSGASAASIARRVERAAPARVSSTAPAEVLRVGGRRPGGRSPRTPCPDRPGTASAWSPRRSGSAARRWRRDRACRRGRSRGARSTRRRCATTWNEVTPGRLVDRQDAGAARDRVTTRGPSRASPHRREHVARRGRRAARAACSPRRSRGRRRRSGARCG